MRARIVALVALLGAERVSAAPLPSQLVVSIGNDVGRDREEPLRHAESDARRVAQLFIELGTATRERTTILAGDRPAAVVRALAEARGRAAELVARGQPVVLVVYYAGHGDTDTLHLGGESLAIASLRATMSEVPASIRLLVIDACRTSGGSRARGAVPGPEFSIDTGGPGLTGDVLITAASEGEPAQESDELGGAVFTHYLLTALRGAADLDGDGRVTLDEAYGYAAGRVLQRTTASATAVQRPAYDLALAGFGPLVLTTPAGAGAHLVLPAGSDVRYFVFSQPSGAPLAEVTARPDGAITLALPPGRFLVHRRARGAVAVAETALPWGGARKLEERDFVAVETSSLAFRGGAPRRAIVDVAYRLDATPDAAAPWASGVALGLELPGRLDGVAVTLTGSRAAVDLSRFTGDEYRLALGVRVRGAYVSTAVLSAWLQGEAFAREVWQHLERQPADLVQAGIVAGESRRATDGGAVAGVGAALAITGLLSVRVGLAGGGVVRRLVASGDGWHVSPMISASLGLVLEP